MMFFKKMRGKKKPPTVINYTDLFWGVAGIGISLSIITLLWENLGYPTNGYFVIASFGPTAVMVFMLPTSPFSQPRNVLGGQMLSAFIGMSIVMLLPEPHWLCYSLAVASAMVGMYCTGTMHPPGCATALTAATGNPAVLALGYKFVFLPVGLGVCILLFIALITNNLQKNKSYPEYW